MKIEPTIKEGVLRSIIFCQQTHDNRKGYHRLNIKSRFGREDLRVILSVLGDAFRLNLRKGDGLSNNRRVRRLWTVSK